jgi:hypothetical protein
VRSVRDRLPTSGSSIVTASSGTERVIDRAEILFCRSFVFSRVTTLDVTNVFPNFGTPAASPYHLPNQLVLRGGL